MKIFLTTIVLIILLCSCSMNDKNQESVDTIVSSPSPSMTPITPFEKDGENDPTVTIIESQNSHVKTDLKDDVLEEKLDLIISGISENKQKTFENQYNAWIKEYVSAKYSVVEHDLLIELLNSDIEYRWLLFLELFKNMRSESQLNYDALTIFKEMLANKSEIPEVDRFINTASDEIRIDNELIKKIIDSPDFYMSIEE